jgi:hypothetical protein
MLTTIFRQKKKHTTDTERTIAAGFKHSTSVGALVMSKRTSYDDLETIMQSGSPRALTPNHHNRNKSDPKTAANVQQSTQPLAFSDPRPGMFPADDSSSSSESDVTTTAAHIHVDPKELKMIEQPHKKKKKGLFHRRHGSSNSDEPDSNPESSATEQRNDQAHKKKVSAVGMVKSLGTGNLYQLTQVTKEKQAAVPQKKKLMPQISLVNAYRQVSELNGFLNTKGSITTLLADVPNLKVSDKFGQEIGTLRSGKSSEKAFVIPKKACGVTTSTYPMISTGKDQKSLSVRYGDPNCDRFGIKVYKHRILVCVTDGCGWGERSCRASEVANHAFMNYIENQHMTVEDTHSAALLMLK